MSRGGGGGNGEIVKRGEYDEKKTEDRGKKKKEKEKFNINKMPNIPFGDVMLFGSITFVTVHYSRTESDNKTNSTFTKHDITIPVHLYMGYNVRK